jgi:hypothetical protein
MFLEEKKKKELDFRKLMSFQKRKKQPNLFLGNSFQVKKKKKEKAEPYIFKTYAISEKKKKTEPFFEKNNLGFF